MIRKEPHSVWARLQPGRRWAHLAVYVLVLWACGEGLKATQAEAPADASGDVTGSSDRWDPRLTLTLRNPFLVPGTAPLEAEPEEVVPEQAPVATDDTWERAEASLAVRGISQMDGKVVAFDAKRFRKSG